MQQLNLGIVENRRRNQEKMLPLPIITFFDTAHVEIYFVYPETVDLPLPMVALFAIVKRKGKCLIN